MGNLIIKMFAMKKKVCSIFKKYHILQKKEGLQCLNSDVWVQVKLIIPKQRKKERKIYSPWDFPGSLGLRL